MVAAASLVGESVTVYLNDKLVVDNVPLGRLGRVEDGSTVTDFDRVRARLGVPDMTSADLMTDRGDADV